MSREDRDRWDDRYAGGAYAGRLHASALLVDWLPRLPRGRALDVACGRGRNALYLAAAGYEVDAVDISPVALALAAGAAHASGLRIRWHEHDLDLPLPGTATWHVIVVTRYLNLPRVRELVRRLEPGGVLLCEVLLAVPSPETGPRDARFRAAPGALRDAAAPLVLLHDEEGRIVDPDGTAVDVARIVARHDAG